MRNIDTPNPRDGIVGWLVFAAVSLAFFFLNMATFTSLGVVLFTMVDELHWSHTAAGWSFAFLGLACGLSSPLPAITMKRIGARITICIGAVLLLAGFAFSSVAHSILSFYFAMALLGLGYSFAGNVPGVYLIAGWFGRDSARVIGFYLMLGAFGAAVGPPIVVRTVEEIGWRAHWGLMSASAAIIGVLCFVFIRDVEFTPVRIFSRDSETAPTKLEAEAVQSEWKPRDAIFTSQFFLIAAAMSGTMAYVTTINSIVINHLVKLGATPTTAAFVLGTVGMTAMIVKAISGWLCERFPAPIITAFGLVLQGLGNLMLAFAHNAFLQFGSAIVFGAGWGFTYVAGTVVMIEYFGGRTGARILAVVWLLVSVAAAGPVVAGLVADAFGTFSPVFVAFAVISIAVAIPIFVMRPPVARTVVGSKFGKSFLARATAKLARVPNPPL